jgi:hypothetical protein
MAVDMFEGVKLTKLCEIAIIEGGFKLSFFFGFSLAIELVQPSLKCSFSELFLTANDEALMVSLFGLDF